MTPSSRIGTFVFTEEVLGRIMSLVLTNKRQMLVENLDPRQFLLTELQQYRVIGRRESDEIKSACSRSVYEGTEKLLDTLTTKGPPGYVILCEALLKDRTQLHLLGALNACLELYKYNYRKYVEQQESQRQYSEYNKERDSQKIKTMTDHHHTTKHITLSCSPSNNIVYPPNYRNNTHHLTPHSNVAVPAHRARSPMSIDEGFIHPEPQIEHPPMNYHSYVDHSTHHQDAFPQTYGNSSMQVGLEYVGTVGYYPDQSYIPCSGADNSYSHIDPGPQALHMTGDFQRQVYLHTGVVQNHAIDIPCGQQGN